MANPSVTNTFVNGQSADAGEVNTNFTDLINSLTDGTKSFSMDAGTLAGALTCNGNVTLGNGSGDDITVTGSIASNFISKTNGTYDLGSSSVAWRALYLDNTTTDGGAVYFDLGTTEFLKSSADGTQLLVGGFTSVLPNTDASVSLGGTSNNYVGLYLDNGVTDGGSIYFDAGSTEFLKSSADGTILNIGGFVNLNPNTDAAVSLGGTSNNYVALYLDNGVTDGGAVYFNAGTTAFLKSGAAGGSLTAGGFTSILPGTDAACDLGGTSNNFQALYLDNAATDGGAIYFNAGTTAFLKSDSGGTDLDMGGFTGFDLAGARIKTNAQYYEAKSSENYTITDTDGVSVLHVTTAASDRTITLPTAAANDGRIITILKEDSGAGKILIDGEGAETINDSTDNLEILEQWDFVTLQCDSTEWFIINQRFKPKIIDDLSESGLGDATVTDITSATMILEAGTYIIEYQGRGLLTWAGAPNWVNITMYVTQSDNTILDSVSVGMPQRDANDHRAVCGNRFEYTTSGETIKMRVAVEEDGATTPARSVAKVHMVATRTA